MALVQGRAVGREGGRAPGASQSKSINSSALGLLKGFHCGSAGKEFTCSAGDLSLTRGLGRSPGEGKGYPLQYYDLENSMHGLYSPWGPRVGHD